MQRTIDVTTARRQFGKLLDEVFYKGETITIERKGKPLARLVPANTANANLVQSTVDSERQRLLDQLHSLPTLSMDEDPTEVLRQIRFRGCGGKSPPYRTAGKAAECGSANVR